MCVCVCMRTHACVYVHSQDRNTRDWMLNKRPKFLDLIYVFAICTEE